jgi:hypothetical protein
MKVAKYKEAATDSTYLTNTEVELTPFNNIVITRSTDAPLASLLGEAVMLLSPDATRSLVLALNEALHLVDAREWYNEGRAARARRGVV